MKQPSRHCREGCFYAEKDPAEKAGPNLPYHAEGRAEKDPAEKAGPNLPYHAEGRDAREIFSGREISEDCPMHRGREGKILMILRA